MSRSLPLVALVTMLLVSLACTCLEARRVIPRRPTRVPSIHRSATWAQLQSELQTEVDSGLDEASLTSLENSVVSSQGAQCLLGQPRQCDTSSPVRVHLDIVIDQGTVGSTPYVGRVSIDLFNQTAPRTVNNFLTICAGNKPGFTYKGNRLHRIITGFMAQGGDITRGDGRGGRSIYGQTFRDETFACHHVCRGSLAMANAGRDTNGSQVSEEACHMNTHASSLQVASHSLAIAFSIRFDCCCVVTLSLQFFITFAPTAWLDGKHVVFGQVAEGWQTLNEMESAGTDNGSPTKSVTIKRCSIA